MDVMLTSKENYDKIMKWFYIQPNEVIRDFPIPKELIVPVPGSRAQLNELLSDSPEEYRINYAKSLNEYHYKLLLSGKKPSLSNKDWYVACSPYDAQFFDVERYTEELREVTGNNTWRFDKVNTHYTGYGITYCFRKERK